MSHAMISARIPVIVIYAMGFAAVAFTVALAMISNRPVQHFTRDPLSVMGAPAYVGLLSNVTAMAWFGAASAACLMAIVLATSTAARRRAAAMAAAAGVLVVLGIDDLFMIHEELLQGRLRVPEKLTMLAYAALAGLVALVFRDQWRASPWRLLAPAALFFGASVGVDTLTTGFGWRLVIEDSLKLMGVVAVAAWIVATARAWLMPRSSAA